MANVELVTYNKVVEKLCIDCVVDVAKLLSQCSKAVGARAYTLASDIAKLSVPDAEDKELEKIPAQANAILKREGSDFAGILTLSVLLKVDVKARKVSAQGGGLSGTLANI